MRALPPIDKKGHSIAIVMTRNKQQTPGQPDPINGLPGHLKDAMPVAQDGQSRHKVIKTCAAHRKGSQARC